MRELYIVLFFLFGFHSAYAQEDCGNGIDDTGNGLIDCNDPYCVGGFVPGGSQFNTATNGSGGRLPGGSNDLSWQVATNNIAGPYIPARVMTAIPGVYYASPWPDCDWIAHNNLGDHTGDVDYYYRIQFYLPCENSCGESYSDPGVFCLSMDFFADNSVQEIYVNGVPQSAGIPNVPAPSPYVHVGYAAAGMVSVSLCNDWRPGLNTMIVHLRSGQPFAGFLAQYSVNAPPEPEDPTITPPPDIAAGYCVDAPTVTFTAASSGGTWSSSCGSCIHSSTGVFNPAVAGPGNHSVTYSAAGICPATNTVIVTVHALPDTDFSYPDDQVCISAAIQLPAANEGGGTFSGPGIVNATTGAFNPAVAGIGTHTITYDISATCTNSGTFQIEVIDVPPLTVQPAGPFCLSVASVTLSATLPGGTWSGTGITDAASGTFSPSLVGEGFYEVVYSIAGNCPVSDTIQIEVWRLPDPTIQASGPHCESVPSVTLTAAEAGGTWSGTGITDAAAGTFSPSLVGEGFYEVIYSIGGNCPVSDTIQIEVWRLPDPTIQASGPHCESMTSVTLTAAEAGGTWSGTGITDAAAGTFSPSLVGEGFYEVVYSIAGNCPVSDTIQIEVWRLPDPTIQASGPHCESVNSVILTAAEAGGTWSGTGITDAAAGTFSPSLVGEGFYEVVYSIAGNCPVSDTIQIEVWRLPDPTIQASGPHCESVPSVTLTAAEAGGTWSGTGITDAAAGTFSPSLVGEGFYEVVYSIAGNCPVSDTIQIEVWRLPDPTIQASGPHCESVPSVTLTAAEAGGTWSGTGITDAVAGTFSPALVGEGFYDIVYAIGGNCPVSDTLQIEVWRLPDPTIQASGPHCESVNSVILTAAEAGGTWSGTGITDAAAGTFSPSLVGEGFYEVVYSIAGNCPVSDTIQIEVWRVPDPTIQASGPHCESVPSVTLTAAEAGGTWSGTGITDAVAGTFSPALVGEGFYDIVYAIGGNCPVSDTLQIEVWRLPDPTAQASGPHCESVSSVTLTAAEAGGTWSGTGITDAAAGTFSPSLVGEGFYEVVYSIAGNCPVSDTIQIEVWRLPDPTIQASGPHCESVPSVTLTAAEAGGTWSGTGITDAAAGTFSPSLVGEGFYEVVYSIAGNCPVSDTIQIEVWRVPDPTIQASGPHCESVPSVTLTAAEAGGTWSGTGITDAASGTFSPSLVGEGFYEVIYSIGGNCPVSDTIQIEVWRLPDPTIQASGPHCESVPSVTLTAAEAGGTWSGTGITDAAAGTFSPSTAGVGLHQIVYSIGGNCPVSDTIQIEVWRVPDPTIQASGPHCESVNSVILTAAEAGGTWSGTGITDAAAGTFSPSLVGEGFYEVVYSIAGNCPVSDTIQIEVWRLPDPTAQASGPHCESMTSVTLTAAEAGGTWSGTGITDAAAGTFSPSTAGEGLHQIIYSIAGNCPVSDTIQIEVWRVPDPTIQASGPHCESVSSVTLTAAEAGGTWSGTGITDAAAGTFSPSLVGEGFYEVVYSIAGNCPVSDTIQIEVWRVPDPTIQASGPHCESVNSVILTAAEAGGTWSGTGITDAASGTFSPSLVGEGFYEVVYSIAGNCPVSDTIQIEVWRVPDPTILPAGPFCISISGTVISAVEAGGTWSGPGITDTTTGTFSPPAAGPGQHPIVYALGGNCPVSDTLFVSVLPLLSGSFTYPVARICSNAASITPTAVEQGGTWSGTGITNQATGEFNPAVAGAGTFVISHVIPGACTTVGYDTLVVVPLPDASITPAGPFCVDRQPLSLTAATPGGTWSGPGITDTLTGLFSPGNAGVGVHTIRYSIAGECPSSATIQVTVRPLDNATFTYPAQALCLTGSSILPVAAQPGGTYSGPGIVDAATGEFNPLTAGSGTHTIVYSQNGNCPNSSTFVITVNAPGNPAIVYSGASVCSGQAPFTLQAIDGGGVWIGNGVVNPVTGLFSPAQAGPGVHQVIYQISGVCQVADTIFIEVLPSPQPQIQGVLPNGCAPVAVALTAVGSSGGSTLSWFSTDNYMASGNVFVHSYLNSGCYTVSLTETDTNGCATTVWAADTSCVSGWPVASFSYSPQEIHIFPEPTPVNFYTTSTGATHFEWYIDGNLISQDPRWNWTPPANPDRFSYLVCLVASNAHCADTTCRTILIKDAQYLYIPNAFTPDNDGINDFFAPSFFGNELAVLEMLIFNRWGEVIHQSSGRRVAWDGTSKGAQCQDGVYVYKVSLLEPDGHTVIEERVGHVTLLR